MIWIFTLFSQVWLGIELFLPKLYKEFSIYGIIASGCLLGISISTFTFFFFSYFFGFNVVHLVIHTIGLFIACFYLNRKRRKAYDYVFKETIVTFFSPFIVFMFSFIFICPIFLTTYGSFIKLIIPTLHEELSLRASFLYGRNKHRKYFFSIEHPDGYGQFIVSRWLTSYHMSMLNLGFGGLRTIFVALSSFYLISYFFVIALISDQFRLKFYIAPFSILLPLFCSGFGYLDFQKDCEKYNLCNSDDPNIDYISYFGKNFDHDLFPNPIFQIIFGNFPMVFSLGLSGLSLFLLYRSIRCIDSCFFMKLAGFIIGGILPAVSHQAFFSMLVFSTLNCLFQLWRQKRQYWDQFKSFFSTFFISFLILNSVRYSNFEYLRKCIKFEYQFDSNIERGEIFPFFQYWFNAFGFYVFIVFGLNWFVFDIVEKQFSLILLLAFFVFNFWQTHPSKMENILTFYPFLFTFCCPVYVAVAQRVSNSFKIPEFKGIAAAFFSIVSFMFCLTTFCSIGRNILSLETVWGDSSFAASNWILDNTDEKAVFLSNRQFLDPIVALAGRSLFLTNDLLALKENIDIGNRKIDLSKFVKSYDGNFSQILNIVDFVAIWANDNVLNKVNPSSSFWKLEYKNGDVRIYKNIKK